MESIDWAYEESSSAIGGDPLLGNPEKKYMVPHYRRSILERRLRDIAVTEGLVASIAQNATGNYEYTKITAGQFLFTIIHHSSTWRIVRQSHFRQHHARMNGLLDQMELNGIWDVPQIEDEDAKTLNAVIYHGTDYRDRNKAGFIKIGIPDPGNRKWKAKFDAYDILAAYTDKLDTNQEDEQENRLIVTWKKKSGEAET